MTFIMNMASGEVELRDELARCPRPATHTPRRDAWDQVHTPALQLITASGDDPAPAVAHFDLTALIDSLQD